MMSPKQLAELLHEREFYSEIDPDELALARKSGLVILFGSWNGLITLRGAIHQTVNCGGSQSFWLNRRGHVVTKDDLPRNTDEYKRIDVYWSDKGDPYWWFDTKIPHVPFLIMKGDKIYAQSIVFSIDDLGAKKRKRKHDPIVDVIERSQKVGVFIYTTIEIKRKKRSRKYILWPHEPEQRNRQVARARAISDALFERGLVTLDKAVNASIKQLESQE